MCSKNKLSLQDVKLLELDLIKLMKFRKGQILLGLVNEDRDEYSKNYKESMDSKRDRESKQRQFRMLLWTARQTPEQRNQNYAESTAFTAYSTERGLSLNAQQRHRKNCIN